MIRKRYKLKNNLQEVSTTLPTTSGPKFTYLASKKVKGKLEWALVGVVDKPWEFTHTYSI